ncbi:hypothetical protein IAR50_006691 [Cryptococcus sp. DSM 104548]
MSQEEGFSNEEGLEERMSEGSIPGWSFQPHPVNTGPGLTNIETGINEKLAASRLHYRTHRMKIRLPGNAISAQSLLNNDTEHDYDTDLYTAYLALVRTDRAENRHAWRGRATYDPLMEQVTRPQAVDGYHFASISNRGMPDILTVATFLVPSVAVERNAFVDDAEAEASN